MAAGLLGECLQISGDIAEVASPGLVAALSAIDDYDTGPPCEVAHGPLQEDSGPCSRLIHVVDHTLHEEGQVGCRGQDFAMVGFVAADNFMHVLALVVL